MRALVCCSFLFVFFVFGTGRAQVSFAYAGYRFGKYFSHEGDAEVLAGKFNLGWACSKTGDNAILLFDPTNTQYKVTQNMEYGNLPQGITLGAVFPIYSNFSVEVGFHQYNQKATGKRTNLSTNAEETFTLQSKSGGLCLNILYTKNNWIRPFIGLDFGRFRFRYSYESDQVNVHKQRMGYQTHLFGGTKPGDKPLYLGTNFGAFIKVFGNDHYTFSVVPQYQSRIDSFEDIFMGLYQHLQFHHDNYSLSFVFTKTLN